MFPYMPPLKKKDIKLWSIGNCSLVGFFEKCFQTPITKEISIENKIALKHMIVKDMMEDIEEVGYTMVSKHYSKLGQTIGFKPSTKKWH